MCIFSCGSATASEFLRLCQTSLAKKELLISECKKNARPFHRTFYPSGRGEGVPEDFRVWFSLEQSGDHFGAGCVLWHGDEVRFIGLYFFVNPAAFRSGNSAELTFVDFQGNVGISQADGVRHTLLAIHEISDKLSNFETVGRNCDIGHFDRDLNLTVANAMNNKKLFFKVTGDQPAQIQSCVDDEIRYLPGRCGRNRTYRSFLNDTKSSVIYRSGVFIVTEEARLYVEEEFLASVCDQGLRSNHFANLVAQVCR